jgi:peptide/nickel transport system permease protein
MILWRMVRVLLVVWLAASLAFFTLRAVPGDALGAQLAIGGASQAEIDRVRAEMNLDADLLTQYTDYMADLLRGDLGYSLVSLLPVTAMIAPRIGPTVALALWTMVIAVMLGLSIGVLATANAWWGKLARGVITLALSTPLYWTGTLAIIVFSAQLGWFASSGTDALFLPVAVLSFHMMGPIARLVSANVQAVRSAPYVIVAYGKGLPRWLILWRYILRNALSPVIAVVALQVGFLLSGAVITESLFVRAGLGQLLLTSVIERDYPVVQGLIVLAALVYLSANVLADLAMRAIDPGV